MAERDIRFTTDLSDGSLAVSADPKRIFQVISNLLGNARKFTPSGGSVRLRAERRDGHVEVTVADTGPGIRAEDQAHIFKPYWQEERAKRHGAGLGLPIARGLVERHGGTLWVRSAPGEGATFGFTLPLGTE